MRITDYLAGFFVFCTLCACKGPGGSGAEPSPEELAAESHSFLEFVLIEARIHCIEGVFGDAPEARATAVQAILNHHGVDSTWLEQSAQLSQSDTLKADKAPILREEARNSVCPGGKPDTELAALIGVPVPAAAPAAAAASAPVPEASSTPAPAEPPAATEDNTGH